MKGLPSPVLHASGQHCDDEDEKSRLTMVNRGTCMVPHGGDLDIASTIGAFDGGQEARIHRHSDFSRSKRALKG